MSVFFAGWIICGPLFGAYSDKMGKRCKPIVLTMLAEAVLFSIVLYTPMIGYYVPEYVLFFLFFLMGAALGTHPLLFALAKENYSNKIAGSVVAFTNTLIMLSGLLITPLVGYLLDFNHHSVGKIGVEYYTTTNYTFALSLIPISLLACIILMAFVKETGSLTEDIEQQYDAALAKLTQQ